MMVKVLKVLYNPLTDERTFFEEEEADVIVPEVVAPPTQEERLAAIEAALVDLLGG